MMCVCVRKSLGCGLFLLEVFSVSLLSDCICNQDMMIIGKGVRGAVCVFECEFSLLFLSETV